MAKIAIGYKLEIQVVQPDEFTTSSGALKHRLLVVDANGVAIYDSDLIWVNRANR